jgi:hypothetical protein
MNLRTASDLSSVLRDDLGWRRKEMVVFRSLVNSTDSSKKQAVLRGAIAVLYAHWEGFVKNAGQQYVEFVKQRRLNLGELSSNFVAMAAKKKLMALRESSKIEPQIEFVEWMLNGRDRRAHLPGSEIISTGSNLTVENFKTIVNALGLVYRPDFALAEKGIIQRLVETRNHLAHGEWQTVDPAEYHQLHGSIDNLMVLVCNDIDAAASLGLYRASSVANPLPI